LPDELKRRETRLKKIREAMKALEEEAEHKASEGYDARRATEIKQAIGFRQFSPGGYANASAEWQMWRLPHNLLKLYRHGGTPL
jgi:hypothetical protein